MVDIFKKVHRIRILLGNEERYSLVGFFLFVKQKGNDTIMSSGWIATYYLSTKTTVYI